VAGRLALCGGSDAIHQVIATCFLSYFDLRSE
jgi:hypothetical protein